MKNNPETHDDLDMIHDDEIRIVGNQTSASFRNDMPQINHCRISHAHFNQQSDAFAEPKAGMGQDFNTVADCNSEPIVGATEVNTVHKKSHRGRWIMLIVFIAGIIVAIILIVSFIKSSNAAKVDELSEPEPALFEPTHEVIEVPVEQLEPLSTSPSPIEESYTEIMDTVINDVPLTIFIPHNAELTLHLGKINKSDSSIIYAAQAADVRADNGGIVGAFVINGEPRAWGLSKSGYCASINGKVTVGVAANSPLFEEATEKGGYFFRQYPLVSNRQIVENDSKGKSVRRAICDRLGEIFMVESGSIESFHDFSQALVDLGVDQAVYLVGSSAYGWAVDADGEVHEFGEENVYSGRRRSPKNINYIVWKKK